MGGYVASLYLQNIIFIHSLFRVHDLQINHHGVEILVTWLVEWSAAKFLILYVTREKQTLSSREILMIEIGFMFLFFDVEKNKTVQ